MKCNAPCFCLNENIFSGQILISEIAQFRYTIAIIKKTAIAFFYPVLKRDRYLFPKIRNVPFFLQIRIGQFIFYPLKPAFISYRENIIIKLVSCYFVDDDYMTCVFIIDDSYLAIFSNKCIARSSF